LPLAAWAIVLVAFLHGAAWSVLTPSFQGADEIAHWGYVQYVGETGKTPDRSSRFAEPARDALAVLDGMPWSIDGQPSWSEEADRRTDALVDRLDDDRANRIDKDGAAYQASNPPLYAYAMAVPYRVTGWFGGDVLDRMLAVRLASSALGALAVLFVLLLLRELFPRRRLAWYVGGLAVALQPVFGWLIGSVNNDIPVLVSGAALLWLVARTHRRGLSPGIAAGLGAAVAVGLLSKVSAYGLVAVLAWSLVFLVWRERARWRSAVPLAGLALAVAVVPLLVLDLVRDIGAATPAPDTGVVREGAAATVADPAAAAPSRSPRDFLSYLWQFWLPRLPFMDDQFSTYPTYPVWETYVQAFAGRFGWFAYGFSPEASRGMVVVLAALIAGAGVALWRRRVALRARFGLIVALVGGFVGYAVMVNLRGWQYRIDTRGENFEQVRYLFPMIGLYGALVGAALLALPDRWRRTAVVLVVLAATLHVLASWGVTLQRYYM